MISRRQFLAAVPTAASAAARPADLVAGIERRTIWRGRDGAGPTWFQTRACAVPGRPRPVVLMTCQTITGSDFYGPVHWSESRDLGLTWSEPRPIPGMGRKLHPDGVEEGVCDTVPEYHAATSTVLAIGHNAYYKDNKLTRPDTMRWPVYTVRRPDGAWAEPRRLMWDNPAAGAIYTCGCAQRLTLPDGGILVPLSYGPVGRADRAVATVLCEFDGRELRIQRAGGELRLPAKRGLLEPSLARLGGRYYMTIRAEDDRGYVTTSADGLAWQPIRPWCWDDGEPLTMSTTQQRWLCHSQALYLVYTRRTEENARVMRWRAPLYLARMDPRGPHLVRASERVVFPLTGDPATAPTRVAHLGNFHANAVTAKLSLVTVGETISGDKFRGDTLVARVHWAKPSR
jgi:hypothetical protein